MIYIGIDDTDIEGSRGTGHLARVIADDLAKDFTVAGVTRHQLFFDQRIPYTAKNSCAAIHLDWDGFTNLPALFERVKAIMLANFEEGSDPGLAVTESINPNIIEFGKRAKCEVLMQDEAYMLAKMYPVLLDGLGGTKDGVIGAMAAVGLAADGNDGRYIQYGAVREFEGPVAIQELRSGGIHTIRNMDGEEISKGLVLAEKLRPSRREGQPVLFVEKGDEHWMPLKLD